MIDTPPHHDTTSLEVPMVVSFNISPLSSQYSPKSYRHLATLWDRPSKTESLPEFDDFESEEYLKRQDAEREREDAERLLREARELRRRAADMEESLTTRRSVDRNDDDPPAENAYDWQGGSDRHPLAGKTVLVTGANGRLGSMVCRNLLRECPGVKVVAAVHYVGEASTRGYGRLSYEVGAEDGVGSIGAAWSEDRTATYQYDPEVMAGYNLQNMRVVDLELLDPVQCAAVAEDVDAVVWCATDFNGNKPRAISGLNFAFSFRAIASPTKGRVEIEGLRNILEALREGKLAKKFANVRAGGNERSDVEKEPTSVVLVSVAENVLDDFSTPFGDFKALKREGERIVREEFRELSHCVLQMGRYDDNFVEEGLEGIFEDAKNDGEDGRLKEKTKRRINRRDAARFCSYALTAKELQGRTVELWTAVR
uniref:Uncharacterized protein n=1 Tax=Corethron hystrix TaxID=216773 RepID=A0A7S1G2F5_9STRA